LWRAALGHASGSLIEAEADARLAFDGRPGEHYMETPWLYGILAQVLVERGAVDEAARILASFEAVVDSFREEDRNHAILFRARAHVASTKGDQRAALTDALASGHIARWMGFKNPAVDSGLTWRSEAALAHHFLGEDDAAQELARAQLELARNWGAPRTLGQALRILGVVEGGTDGLERLQEAAAVLELSPARLEYGYALTDLGSALRRGNQRTAAREPLRLALELAQRGGAKLLADRAHEELIASGARPRRLFASGVDALTPSERRVAAMAAEGLSNREIAQALFVTLRTVETHLSSAFRKLDVSARTQLAAALAAVEEAPVAGRAG
jgi:DNA-binding CsgD family transcriptional regulator